jgi:hypothetical protein
MAAIIRMIATTINSSINEKPFCLLRIEFFPSDDVWRFFVALPSDYP